jgi:hypothetical protein
MTPRQCKSPYQCAAPQQCEESRQKILSYSHSPNPVQPEISQREDMRSRGNVRMANVLAGSSPSSLFIGGDAIYAHAGHAGGPTFGSFTPSAFAPAYGGGGMRFQSQDGSLGAGLSGGFLSR